MLHRAEASHRGREPAMVRVADARVLLAEGTDRHTRRSLRFELLRDRPRGVAAPVLDEEHLGPGIALEVRGQTLDVGGEDLLLVVDRDDVNDLAHGAGPRR